MLSKAPAAGKLIDALLAKAPAKLVAPAILAALKPETAATAFKLLEAYPSVALDAVSFEPLLAKDAERLKNLMFDSSCAPLIKALCAKGAARKA